MFKVNIKTPERCHRGRPGVFMLTLNIFTSFFVSIVDYEC